VGISVTVDDRGRALAVYNDADKGGVWGNRFTPGTGWSGPFSLYPGILAPTVAVDAQGNLLVAWGGTMVENFTVTSGVWARRFLVQ
jgi:hypothetical protein